MQVHALIENKVAAAAPPYAILVIAAPLARIDLLARILRDLPVGFRLPIVVALLGQERVGASTSDLPARLQPHTSLAVRWMGHRVSLRAGTVSLCEPGESMIVGSDGVAQRLPGKSMGPSRSARTLLASVAASHGERVLGLVLGGTGRSDECGIRTLKARGATLVAQDEAAAHAWGSARNAVDSGDVDLVVPVERIASTLVHITAAIRRPGGTGAQRTVAAQLFPRERGVPYEVAAVQRAMHRVLGAIEQLRPRDGEAELAHAQVGTPRLGVEIADELRPMVAAAGRSLSVDCAPTIAGLSFGPEIVRELVRRLSSHALAASTGGVEIRISALRLFLQIVVAADGPIDDGAPEDLRGLQAFVRPLRGHVVATKKSGRIECAVWLPKQGH